MTGPDRVGLGWRPALAAGIFANLDAIDVVEVMAEDFMNGPRRQLASLATLRAQVPVVVHGLSLGLASVTPVQMSRLDALARVVDVAQPLFWSEHLAFVRAGGIELGHLAAPPRTQHTIEGAAANLARCARIVGCLPLVENVATLVQPPGPLDEAAWISAIASSSNAGLLLDLHNLYANAVNFGQDPTALLARLPLEQVQAVHLAGGRWLPGRTGPPRRLDDHLHPVPEAVFALLVELAARVTHPLTVILERDGAYPPFALLRRELDRARAALAAGRLRQASEEPAPTAVRALGGR